MFDLLPVYSSSLLWLAFVVWMAYDCFRTTGNYLWVLFIFFFQPIGAIIYFAMYVLPTLDVKHRIDRLFGGGRRMRELKAQIHNMDRPYHWTKLGDEYRDRRKWNDAAKCYEEALQREPANEEAQYGLGLVRLKQGRAEEALDLLEPLAGENPGYAFGEGTLAVARAWKAIGRPDEAIAAYEKVMSRYTYPEAQYECAVLMHEHGDKERAAGLLRRLVIDGKNASGFHSGRERRWGMKANLFLKMRVKSA